MPLSDLGVRVLGRYALYDEIAAGGMATVHVGRLLGPVGFSRTVAIKRLHPQFAKDPDFVSMFLDEARLAARVRHPNVIGTLDVVALSGELFLVMEYVPGESFAKLWRTTRDLGRWIPASIVASVVTGVLEGLHAAHEATSDRGEPLGIVHRDVSPHNVMVGTDGVARVLDFGVAKATGRVQTTREGQLKGKISYMAPEQVQGIVDRTTDVYAASVVLWEGLTGQRLFFAENEARTLANVLYPKVVPPSEHAPGIPPELDAVVLRGLHKDRAERYATAREMARDLQRAIALAPTFVVGEWVEATAGVTLASRAARVASIERMAPPDSHSGPAASSGASSSPASAIASSLTPPPMTRSAPPSSNSAIDLLSARRDEPSRSGQLGSGGSSGELPAPDARSDAQANGRTERRFPPAAGAVASIGLLLAVGALSAATVMRLHPQPHGVAIGPGPAPAAAPLPAMTSAGAPPPALDASRGGLPRGAEAARPLGPGTPRAPSPPANAVVPSAPTPASPAAGPASPGSARIAPVAASAAKSASLGSIDPSGAPVPTMGGKGPPAGAGGANPGSPASASRAPASASAIAPPSAIGGITSPTPRPAPGSSAKATEGEFEHVIDSRK